MASAVDIANLALSHIGDTANIASLTEDSVQAMHANRFYPMARNTLLELHSWSFATTRVALSPVTNPSTSWAYAYALPSNLVKVLAILPSDAAADYQVSYSDTSSTNVFTVAQGYTSLLGNSSYIPREYVIENGVILTNEADAVCRYTTQVTDTTKFSSAFIMALSYLLASMLAGPIIKGDAGASEAKRCLSLFELYKSQAVTSDANQRKVTIQPTTWVR